MSKSFFNYVKKTYPQQKKYALAALQDAVLMLKCHDESLYQNLMHYFQLESQAWLQLRELVSTQGQYLLPTIRVCTGPVCHNKKSKELFLKTYAYVQGQAKKYVLEETHCQGKCHQAPVVFVENQFLAECREENIISCLK